MTFIRSLSIVICLQLLCVSIQGAESFTAEQLEFFEKEVRPILVESCHECHGAEEQEASLRLDSRSAILKGGDTGPAIVPGDVSKSEISTAISYDPDGYQMPPDGKLPDEKIAILNKWIKMGAPWPNEGNAGADLANEFNLEERAQHWSFLPLKEVKLPTVKNQAWVRNAIDHFVLAKLEEQPLSPAPEADRNTWIRRTYIDVIGLPPSPEEVHAFLADDSPEAYQTVIDRLLKSSHNGERWGRHWLDLMRYAESRGHEFDYSVANPWHYRDYVIRALNDDLPFDQFVVEHVAGDLLKDAEQALNPRYCKRINPETGGNESILATGFWFLGEWVHSPVDIRQEEADRFDNMIDVYSKSFLGLTVACARCHDHKFDPIPQTDYYALQGYLQSTSYRQARFETMEHNRAIADQLEAIDNEYRKRATTLIRDGSKNVRDYLEDYRAAALDLIKQGAKAQANDDILLADFESGTYQGWTVTGDAFGEFPQTQQTIGSYQGDVKAQGKFFINSHQHRTGRGDQATGTLTSAPFVIERNSISMLIGGGAHAGTTCVNLNIDGNVVLSATGKNSNQMSPVQWDVSNYQGQTAVIEVIDNETGGWGNIGVDQIVLTDSEVASRSTLSSDSLDLVKARAANDKLDAQVLSNWVLFLLSDKNQQKLFSDLEDKESRQDERKRIAAEFHQQCEDRETCFSGQELMSEDVGFRHRNGIVSWDPVWFELNEPSENIQEQGALSSWHRGGRVLRTPTFEIQSGKIYALVRGEVNTYFAVDSHITINGPLHGGLVRKHGSNPEWHWIEHSVSGYEGQNAHLEFIPQGKDPFDVAFVIQTSELSQAARQTGLGLANSLSQETDQVHGLNSLNAISLIDHPELFFSQGSEVAIAIDQLNKQHQQQRNVLLAQIKKTSHTAPVMQEGNGLDEHLFIRGKWMKNGGVVPRRFLKVFGGHVGKASLNQENIIKSELTQPIEQRSSPSGRYELAMAMVDPKQTPILPRVIVNRIWQHYFGRGIVPTPDDFGHLGQPPSHPELLDYLANELVTNNWSQKHIHQLILSSATYRMSSQLGEDKNARLAQEVDPENKLLHRMNIKRMEGEIIRDSILTVSGRLDPAIGGPSVPVHLTNFMQGRGRPGTSGPVDGNGRRSLYVSVRRNFPDPFFQAFDFPTPHSCIGKRNVSNVPAQALGLLNNPMVVEQSRVWAQNLMNSTAGQSVENRINWLFEAAFSRAPTDQELSAGSEFIASFASEKMSSTEDISIWADYCHVLLNMKEFIFVK